MLCPSLGPGHALKAGPALPRPEGICPRYVEADAEAAS